jgi:hypothetical protein
MNNTEFVGMIFIISIVSIYHICVLQNKSEKIKNKNYFL